MNNCYKCKWFKEIEGEKILYRPTTLNVCTNPETFQKSGIWWPDGNSVKIDNNPPYIEVGSNFGCVNWEQKEQNEVKNLNVCLNKLLTEKNQI